MFEDVEKSSAWVICIADRGGYPVEMLAELFCVTKPLSVSAYQSTQEITTTIARNITEGDALIRARE